MSSDSSPGIQIVKAEEAKLVTYGENGEMKSRRLIRREMGSERVSLNYTVTEATSEEFDSDYPEHDELMFVISGVGEMEWEGSDGPMRIEPGMAVFVPQGHDYRYRVIEAPQEAVVVFGPANP